MEWGASQVRDNICVSCRASRENNNKHHCKLIMTALETNHFIVLLLCLMWRRHADSVRCKQSGQRALCLYMHRSTLVCCATSNYAQQPTDRCFDRPNTPAAVVLLLQICSIICPDTQTFQGQARACPSPLRCFDVNSF